MLSISASATTASGMVVVTPPAAPFAPVTSDQITITTQTPIGSVSFAWARISGSTSINVNILSTSSSDQTVEFSSTDVPLNTTQTAVFRCTVNDAGGTVRTVDITVDLTYRDSL